jgi:hypothetical protein
MGTLKYEPIFQIQVKNHFYQDENSREFVLVPTVETWERFANYRFKARTFENGIEVYNESRKTDTGFEPVFPVEDIADYTRFTFVMQVKDGQNADTMKVDAGQPDSYGTLGNAIYYFDNGTADDQDLKPLATNPAKIALSTFILNFHYKPVSGSGDQTLDVFGPEDPTGAGTPLVTKTVSFNTATGSYDAQIDLVLELNPVAPAKGKYMLKLGTLNTQYFYVDENLMFGKPFGVIEIRKPTLDWATPGDYSINFAPAPLNWRYHFLFKSGEFDPPDPPANIYVYSVVDTVGSLEFCYGGTVGGDPTHVIFYSADDASATDGAPDLHAEAAVDAAEMAIAGIDLKLGSTSVVMDLANPTVDHLVVVDKSLPVAGLVIYADVFVYL